MLFLGQNPKFDRDTVKKTIFSSGLFLSLSLAVYICILSVCLSVCLCVNLFIHLCLSIYLSFFLALVLCLSPCIQIKFHVAAGQMPSRKLFLCNMIVNNTFFGTFFRLGGGLKVVKIKKKFRILLPKSFPGV